MIRPVEFSDAAAIAGIYNEYVLNTTISFEVDAVTVGEMAQRIASFSSSFPYFVFVENGTVLGYAYAHAWKTRAAYAHTWETTVYVKSDCRHKGIGTALMKRLIESAKARNIHALIACVTSENDASMEIHKKLGFKQVACFLQVGRKFERWVGVNDFELLL